MTQWPLLSQAVRYQRAVADSAFSVVSASQSRGADMLENSLNQYPWLSENEKKGCLIWARGVVRATDNLKSIMDRSYRQIEKQVDVQSPADEKATEQKMAVPAEAGESGPESPKTNQESKSKTAPAVVNRKAPVKRGAGNSVKNDEDPAPEQSATPKKEAAAPETQPVPTAKRKPAAAKATKAATGTTKKTTAKGRTTTTARKTPTGAARKPAAASKTAAAKATAAEKQGETVSPVKKS